MDVVVNSSFQVMGSRTPIKPSQLNLLNIGDHIGWQRHFGHWHHAIVHSIDSQNDAIVVIHFTKTSLNEGFKILKEKLNVYTQEGCLVRFNYPNDIKESNPPEVVLERAVEKIGEMGYNVFKNNCEHFAIFCKTGRKICAGGAVIGGGAAVCFIGSVLGRAAESFVWKFGGRILGNRLSGWLFG